MEAVRLFAGRKGASFTTEKRWQKFPSQGGQSWRKPYRRPRRPQSPIGYEFSIPQADGSRLLVPMPKRDRQGRKLIKQARREMKRRASERIALAKAA